MGRAVTEALGGTVTLMHRLISIPRSRLALLLCPIAFLAFGPAIGYVVGIAQSVLFDAAVASRTTSLWQELSDVLRTLPLAYLYGGPSALLTGFLYALLILKSPVMLRRPLLQVVLAGASGGLAAGLLNMGVRLEVMISGGVVAGIVCGLLVAMKDVTESSLKVPPNNSVDR